MTTWKSLIPPALLLTTYITSVNNLHRVWPTSPAEAQEAQTQAEVITPTPMAPLATTEREYVLSEDITIESETYQELQKRTEEYELCVQAANSIEEVEWCDV